jgi:hypothetical protein
MVSQWLPHGDEPCLLRLAASLYMDSRATGCRALSRGVRPRQEKSMNLRYLALAVIGLVYPSMSSAQSTASATRYPIFLSHHWGGSSTQSFFGDWDTSKNQFKQPFGIKQVLEADGAVVYQPDKIPFGDHILRGKLLYKKCKVTTPANLFANNETQQRTVNEALCLGENPVVVDGVEKGMADYCADPGKRAGKYASEDDCRKNIKINIICHSQGCPDSRYMISGMINQLSGKPMADHVASWTSLAGANKGTALADAFLGITACTSGCTDSFFGDLISFLGFSLAGSSQNGQLSVYNPLAMDSVRSLTRKYMTQTMDLSCDPTRRNCAPSFNMAYPISPKVFYQTYNFRMDRTDECSKAYTSRRDVLWLLDGTSDGLITVESQRFGSTGYGINSRNVFTNVMDRGIVMGEKLNPNAASYPGMTHMVPSTHPTAGMTGAPCAASTAGDYYFSREKLYKDIVHDLKTRGF